MSEHWHQQLSKAAEGFGSVSVSRSYLRDALARIRELEAQQPTGEPVAWYVERVAPGVRDHGIRYGPTFSETEADRWTDEIHMKRPLYAHPRPREQTAGEPVAWDSLLRELRQCAATWEPQVVLLGSGNLTSARIVALCDHFLTHPRPRVGVTEAMVEVSAICMSDAWYEGEVAWTDLNENAKTTFRTMARDSLTAALALADEAAPGVVELDEWRVVDKDGTKVEGCDSLTEADHARTRHDVLYPKTAPHKVLQVYVREVLS